VALLRDLLRKGVRGKIDILVYRYSFSGELRMARPCSHCLAAMATVSPRLKVRRIYYSNDDGEVVRSTVNKLVGESRPLWGVHGAGARAPEHACFCSIRRRSLAVP